jgi:hypothetical protein
MMVRDFAPRGFARQVFKDLEIVVAGNQNCLILAWQNICSCGVPKGIALADAGYGNDKAFRSGLTELGLEYVVGLQGSMTVWAPRNPAAGNERAEWSRLKNEASAP